MEVTATIVISMLLLETLLVSPALSDATVTDTEGFARKKRFLFNWLFGPQCGGPGDCPPHHCSYDQGVLYGYCCGCAQPGDRVPIPCPPFLDCPHSPHPLCAHYNYMMDCCC